MTLYISIIRRSWKFLQSLKARRSLGGFQLKNIQTSFLKHFLSTQSLACSSTRQPRSAEERRTSATFSLISKFNFAFDWVQDRSSQARSASHRIHSSRPPNARSKWRNFFTNSKPTRTHRRSEVKVWTPVSWTMTRIRSRSSSVNRSRSVDTT